MQKGCRCDYTWIEELMEFDEENFEEMSRGMTNNISVTPYKSSTGKEIESKGNVQDLGIITNKMLKLKEHTDKVVLSS